MAHTTYEERNIPRGAGFNWDADRLYWFSTDYHAAEKLIRYCDEAAVQHIRLLKHNVKKSVELSAKSEGTMKLYHPPTVTPYPYQIAGVEYILPRSAALLADQPGLGKTGQAFLTMNMRQHVECLIVCPSILKYNWLKEARKWLIGTVKAVIYESKRIRLYEKKLTDHPKTTVLHIINYDILYKFRERLLGIPYNFFVADESHNIKNEDARRTQISKELAKKAKWKIFITGTPIYNKPKDLYVTLNLIDPIRFSNFKVFTDTYCSGTKRDTDELNQLLRANYMVRRMAKDVLKDLPDKVKDVIVLTEESLAGVVAKEQQALKKSQENDEKLKAEVENLKELVKDNVAYEAMYKDKIKTLRESKFKNFGEISKIRKELAVKKVPYVIEFVKEHLESSEDGSGKIVVFGHHTEVLEAIFKGLKAYKPVIITGKVGDKDRQQSIERFSEKNDCRVFIGSMGAAGTGVDGLQNNCNTVVFAELDWTPSLVDQAESRLQRIGQKNTVWVYHIVADGSIDSRIAKLMVEKEGVARQILDYRPDQIYEGLVQGKL